MSRRYKRADAESRLIRDRAIVKLYADGFDTYLIAEVVGLTRPRVCQILHENGVESRPWHSREVSRGKVWTTDRQFRQLVNGAVGQGA